MADHPCGDCLNWWECNGVAWGTPDCPKTEPDPLPPPLPIYYIDEKTESGLLEED